uniref:Uncharacterized protein n=1 Tax=Plectus sambesii TaxID=2011161 RepID=A0A914X6W9_9BILA
MIGQAPNRIYRAIWIFLFITCMSMFWYNAHSVVEKYNRNEKIVDIQLKFDTAPFPAITLCNLNPYKASRASSVDVIKRTLSAFDGAMVKAGGTTGAEGAHEIRRRAADMKNAVFEPGYSKCECPDDGDPDEECDGGTLKYYEPTSVKDKCICAFDRDSTDAWPCHLADVWTKEKCESCDKHAHCKKVGTTPGAVNENKSCLCAPSGFFCVAWDGHSVLDIWQFLNPTEATEDPGFIEAMGFTGMTDEVAIVTKAKENIMFAMAALPMSDREALSTTKRELVQKCSFNGIACDIEHDFLTHVDPVFGSCFTYNHNRTMNLTSIRAGPMYGLRMLVYVNASDYMPTTEATGVRMTIHDKEDFPFPDTFGYSAPTGYISSFGIKLRKMSRLPAPYGDCVPDGKTKEYIYSNYEYSVEGCYRSCFQQLVLKDCGCGDPRFPVLQGEGHHHCDAADPVARRCLDARTTDLGGLHGSFRCRCQQPCHQSIYSVTYSAAKWPSQSLQIQLGACEGTPEHCNKHYKDNGAMVEVFYEQLNFEMLRESEAYGVSFCLMQGEAGWVNLLADFGGQLGLWCGISFLTCFEFIFLFVETAWMSGRHNYAIWKRKQEEKRKAKERW